MKVLIWIVAFLPSLLLGQVVLTNIDDAIEKTISDDKLMLMVFSGSDWCKPCIKLKKEIIKTKEFMTFADLHLVYLELDFPYSKKNALSDEQLNHNEALAEKYNPQGAFPKVLLLDGDLKVLGSIDYKKGMSTSTFIKQISLLKV